MINIGQGHGQRNRETHKDGIGESHKEHQHNGYQNKTDDDGIVEFFQNDPGIIGLVTGNGNI